MRNAVLFLVFGGLATFVACGGGASSRSPASGGPGDTTSTGAGGTVGAGPNGSLLGTADGGLSGTNPSNMTVADPVPDPCMTTADCPGGGAGYVCTVANKCGKISGNCDSQSQCSGDTYCCKGAECRKDAQDQGVCIPGYVPPGVACKGEAHVGVFSPAVQCDWPGANTPKDFPQHVQVFSTPMVADTPIDSGTSAEIIFVAGNQTSGEIFGTDAASFGVIRIVSGQTCELKATIADPANPLRQSASPALGDLDGDGKIDIVARRNDHGLVAFHWNDASKKYETLWAVTTDAQPSGSDQVWDGPAIHDLNDDGVPEVILRTAVYDGKTGKLITAGPTFSQAFNGLIPVIGDLDGDGKLEIITAQQFSFLGLSDWTGSSWTQPVDNGSHKSMFGTFASHFAYADFGTLSGGKFDPKALDGKPEIVAVNAEGDGPAGRVSVYSQDEMGNWTSVLQVDTPWDPTVPAEYKREGGGPPTIGDFDGDGFPEFAIAGGTRFRVFDFDCQGNNPACESDFVRWSRPSQDASSKQTGGSAFDFDGDGAVEVVYADECFLRVYDGKTGDVKYSAYRTSATWYEGPVIADVNKDQSTKIVVNSTEIASACPAGSTKGTPYVDPIHLGVRCLTNDDCTSKKCDDGLCRCTTAAECGDPGLACVAPPASGNPAKGNTCRAQNPNGSGAAQRGIRVLKDRLDRWASSRPMWNQHAYSVTNINDDGTIPKTSDWIAKQNFKMKGLNNYRQNVQGTTGVDDLPDITGKFLVDDACQVSSGGDASLTVSVCNRGKRAVPAALPVTFYDDAGGILCTGLTDGPVPTGSGCKPVSCNIKGADLPRVVNKVVTIKVNDDGMGQRSTIECNYDNNTDTLKVSVCPPAK
jgi:hypothetical protein